MAIVNTVSLDCEVRAVIKFLNAEKVSGAEIHRRLCAVYGEGNVMTKKYVYEWIKLFNAGRTNTHDEPRSGRPSTAVNDESVACVRFRIHSDRRFTVSDIHREEKQYLYVEISSSSIWRILTDEFSMKKVCARWVPRRLIEENLKNRMGTSLEFLLRYSAEGENFLYRIVTGDETWIHY